MEHPSDESVLLRLIYSPHGPQFYVITAAFNNTLFKVRARYKDFQEIRGKIPNTNSVFPGKSTFGSTKGDPAKTELRRYQLQKWLTEVLHKSSGLLEAFLRKQIATYGDLLKVDEKKAKEIREANGEDEYEDDEEVVPYPSWRAIAPHPAPLYATEGTLRAYNSQRKNWPKVGEASMLGLMSITYGCRSLVGVHVNGSIFSLRYFPWGRHFDLGSLAVLLDDKTFGITKFYTTFDPTHQQIWTYGERNLFMHDLKKGKWKIIPSPLVYTSELPVILIDAGEEMHILSTTCHHLFVTFGKQCNAFNLRSEQWEGEAFSFVAPEIITNIVWDQHNHLFTASDAFKFDVAEKLKSGWKRVGEIAEEGLGYVFASHEFGEGAEIDEEYEKNLIVNYILAKKGPWKRMFKDGEISLYAKEQLILLDEMGHSGFESQFNHYKQNKQDLISVFCEVFNSMAGWRIHDFILLLLREDPSIEDDIPELAKKYYRKTTKSNGTITFHPHVTQRRGYFPPLETPLPKLTSRKSSRISSSPKIAKFSNPTNPTNVPNSPSSFSSSTSSTLSNNFNSSSPSSSSSPLSSSFNAVLPEELSEEEAERRHAIIARIKDGHVEVPAFLLCPITLQIMFDPVVLPDGHTYERVAISEWLAKGNLSSPLTSQPLSTSFEMIPNVFALNVIIAFLGQNKIL